MAIGRTSSNEPVRKFSTPFFVEASFTRWALEPVVFCRDPSVRNRKSGPLALVMAVRKGDITSSACFIVGAVVTWCVVWVLTLRQYAWMQAAYIDLAAPRATIRYCLTVKRFMITLGTNWPPPWPS